MELQIVLRSVRQAFGLSARETAEVCGVSISTVYDATCGDGYEVRPCAFDPDRLAGLYRIALHWNARKRLVGGWARFRLPCGQGVFDMLKAPRLDEMALMEAHSMLHGMRNYFRTQESACAIAGLKAMGRAFAKAGDRRRSDGTN